METVVQSNDAEPEETSTKQTSHIRSHTKSHKKQEEKVISSQFSGGYAPSILPWTDHGRTKASMLPSCNCKRDTSADAKPVSKEKNDIVTINQLVVVLIATLFCFLQFFIYKLI